MKMAHLQYIPGDPRLVDQLVYELKSKGIFDQFRKDCIADVDTRPAYQNLRQRVENSVSTFLSRQVWKPDLNKNQLREKLRKHILDGNYLEQGVERIVDQVVNPKVASVFIPQVEDLVYNYLGITRKKTAPVAETSNGKVTKNDLLPTDLEAVSPGSVKSNDDKMEEMDISVNGEETKMDIDEKSKDVKEEDKIKTDPQDTQLSGISELTSNDSISLDKSSIPLPSEEIKLENIPAPESSPPKAAKVKVELEKIQLPLEPNPSTDIPLPEEAPKLDNEHYFKPVNSDDDDSSDSDSSLIRNMSPLTPIRNFNNENSCDAQQAFEDDAVDSKSDEKKESGERSTFRFTIETKAENSSDAVKTEKKETEALSYQFNNQININTFNTPMYDDSSNSNHLQIDYESDASKTNTENKIPEPDHNSEDSKKDKKSDEKKSSHRSSHHRDSHRHSSSKDRKSDSKQSSSKDSKSDKKSSKDDHKSSSKSSSHKDKSSDRSDKKDSRESSKHRSSSSHKSSSSHRDSKSHRSSSSSQRHSSSSKHNDEKKSCSSSHKDKSESKSSDKYSKEKSSKDSKSSSSSHRSDKDRKSSSSSKSKSEDKDKQKKDKKETDDHYSASGRGTHTRRSTDRDSNDGSSSSKGSQNQTNSKSSDVKKEGKGSTSKSDNTSTSGDSTSPSDKDSLVTEVKSKGQSVPQVKPIVRIEDHLEVPISSPPRLPFVPDVTLKKPKFAANMQEARKLMKMRKFLDEEQKRMNQEAALLLEFQANVRPSLSQVYSSIPGPELEFACVTTAPREVIMGDSQAHAEPITGQGTQADNLEARNDTINDILNAAQQVEDIEDKTHDKQEIHIQSISENTETVNVKSEVEDETDKSSNEATVKLENILEVNLESCDMDVDKLDEKSMKIVEILPVKNEIENKDVCDGLKEKEDKLQVNDTDKLSPNNETPEDDGIEQKLQSLMEDSDNTRTEYFQVTIITEELSETEDTNTDSTPIISIKEELCPEEIPFRYFEENEKYFAEVERDRFNKFLKSFQDKTSCKKMYLVNCDTYEENILKEVSENFGRYEIVNYYKNGHLKLNGAKNIVRNINVDSEISLPANLNGENKSPLPIFSPVKSECSFELSSDYDAKLEEMVSKTSRKEIMEIILGSVVDESATEASEMPTIDYCNESNIESDTENIMKRKYCEVGSSVNNNRQVLTPNKIRKLSGSDQISSTTEESEEASNNNVVSNPIRSKYLGRAKRVGLPRPRRSNLPNSPSSDKSVENYEENVQATQQPNGKLKTARNKVQRYDTSDLYKPKLHYLSRRNNIS